MRGTIPIVTCDDESGCDDYLIDHYEMGASNWQEFLEGWQYDPRRYDEIKNIALCPKHRAETSGS